MADFETRFRAAKLQRKQDFEEEAREAYKFCFNGREIEWDRKTDGDPEEIFADDISTIAEEFYGELFSTMTPENTPWVEYEAGVSVHEDDVKEVKDLITERERKIEKSIQASNYYDEGPTAFQEAVVGNVALWVDRHHIHEPITCEAVPCSELYLRLGPKGIEDRFREKSYYYTDLPQLFPDGEFSRELKDKIKNSKGRATVVWGFWRNYDDPGNPIWRQEIRVDKEQIGLDQDFEGDGSISLLVGRFNAQPNSPWGRGPARRMLPTIRVYDELIMMNMENMSRQNEYAYTYPHDGMLDLSEGIEDGMGYPAMPGTGDQVRPLGLEGNLDYGFFGEDKFKEHLRDGFYREIEQRGKTPPSASQYMGQEQKQIRRMARPAGKLWREFGVGLLKRFEYLETQPGGSLADNPQILLDDKIITVRPISPLERAQAREEVLTSQSIMAMTQEALGPEQAGLVIDGPTSMTNIKEKLKDKLVVFRSEDQIMEMMQQMQPQQQEPQGEPQG